MPTALEIPASGPWTIEATVPACLVATPDLQPDPDGLARVRLALDAAQGSFRRYRLLLSARETERKAAIGE